ADGSCRLACPVGIDTGKLIKDFRGREHNETAERMALRTARKWGAVERTARGGLKMGKAISRVTGNAPLRGLTRVQRAAFGAELMPEWGEAMPPAAPAQLPTTERQGAAAVYV